MKKLHINLLEEIFTEHALAGGPFDLFLRRFFKAKRFIGASERRLLSETAYTLVRWKRLIDGILGRGASWKKRVDWLVSNLPFAPEVHMEREDLSPHAQVGFPKPLYDQIIATFGVKEGRELCLICNERAPMTIRANQHLISRETLLEKLKKEVACRPTLHSEGGIYLDGRINIFGSSLFKKGYFEVQDEASQVAAEMVLLKPGEKVLDYCAGSGGKTLAFAHRSEGKGQIFLHDIREQALFEAKKRCRRAGLQNIQFIPHQKKALNRIKQKMDWIVVDAPCSGSGTLRRNPDQKERFDLNGLDEVVLKQREIVAEAIAFAKPGSFLVYMTCSIFPEENEQQIEYFQKKFGLILDQKPFSSLPSSGGMDGFFAARLQIPKIK
ncbi:MAG: Ribosomal RNA small subunit methyltransferase B [Chlamydiia bacterium]|nr:Ribosomal RNA small subunit methyltransferase B [Chlamydiia bacterium]